MMMTQKKLLVSGIRWQVGKRRKGKPSSSVFGQTSCIFSLCGCMSLAKAVFQALSRGFVFRTTYKTRQSARKTASLLLQQLQTALGPSWYHGTSLPFGNTRQSLLDLKVGPAVAWPCLSTKRCSVSAAFPLLQPVFPNSLSIWAQERKRLKETAEFPQHSCDDFALVRGHVTCRIPKYILLNFKATWFSLSYC